MKRALRTCSSRPVDPRVTPRGCPIPWSRAVGPACHRRGPPLRCRHDVNYRFRAAAAWPGAASARGWISPWRVCARVQAGRWCCAGRPGSARPHCWTMWWRTRPGAALAGGPESLGDGARVRGTAAALRAVPGSRHPPKGVRTWPTSSNDVAHTSGTVSDTAERPLAANSHSIIWTFNQRHPAARNLLAQSPPLHRPRARSGRRRNPAGPQSAHRLRRNLPERIVERTGPNTPSSMRLVHLLGREKQTPVFARTPRMGAQTTRGKRRIARLSAAPPCVRTNCVQVRRRSDGGPSCAQNRQSPTLYADAVSPKPVVGIRLSAADRDEIDRRARECRMTRTEYMVRAALDELPRTLTIDDRFALSRGAACSA